MTGVVVERGHSEKHIKKGRGLIKLVSYLFLLTYFSFLKTINHQSRIARIAVSPTQEGYFSPNRI